MTPTQVSVLVPLVLLGLLLLAICAGALLHWWANR